MLSKRDIQFINKVKESESLSTIIHKRKKNLNILKDKNNKFAEENYMNIINRIINFTDGKTKIKAIREENGENLETYTELNSTLLTLINEKVEIETTNLKVANILSILKKLKNIYLISKKIERGDIYRKIKNISLLQREIEIFRDFKFYNFLKDLLKNSTENIFKEADENLDMFFTACTDTYEGIGIQYINLKEENNILISEKYQLREKINFTPLLTAIYIYRKLNSDISIYQKYNIRREEYFNKIKNIDKVDRLIAYLLVEYYLIDTNIQFNLKGIYGKLIMQYFNSIMHEKMDYAFNDLIILHNFLFKYFHSQLKLFSNQLISLFFNYVNEIQLDEKVIRKIGLFIKKFDIRELDEIFFKRVDFLVGEEYEEKKITKDEIILYSKYFIHKFSVLSEITDGEKKQSLALIEKFKGAGKKLNSASDFKKYVKEIENLNERRVTKENLRRELIETTYKNFTDHVNRAANERERKNIDKEIAKIVMFLREEYSGEEEIFIK